MSMDMETAVEPTSKRPLSQSRAWTDLEVHFAGDPEPASSSLFTTGPDRGRRMMAEGVGICLDYSKNRITGVGRRVWRRLRREISSIRSWELISAAPSSIFTGRARSLRLKRMLLAHRHLHRI
jgi:hypothetical protein